MASPASAIPSAASPGKTLDQIQAEIEAEEQAADCAEAEGHEAKEYDLQRFRAQEVFSDRSGTDCRSQEYRDDIDKSVLSCR